MAKKLSSKVANGKYVVSHDFNDKSIDFFVQPTEEGTQILCRNLRVLALVQIAVTKYNNFPVMQCGLLANMPAIKTSATPEQLAEFLPFSLEKARKTA